MPPLFLIILIRSWFVPFVTAQLVEAIWEDSAFNSYFCDTLTSPTEQVSNWEISLYKPWLSQWMAHLTGVSEVVLVPPEASTISTPSHPQNWQALLEEYPHKPLASFFMSGISHGFRIGFNQSPNMLISVKKPGLCITTPISGRRILIRGGSSALCCRPISYVCPLFPRFTSAGSV